MEFKSIEKWQVQRDLNLTEVQLEEVIRRAGRRHPMEDWVHLRVSGNGDVVEYLKLEFVYWLKEVYFNKEKFYLDLEIEFFEKQIKRLESELNISPYEFKYEDTSLKDLRSYFNKSKNAIGRAVNEMKMQTNLSYKYLKDGRVMITKEGVKWLAEKYFRKAYLKDLELYKLELQERKMKLDDFNRRKIQ